MDLRSYRAAMRDLGNLGPREMGALVEQPSGKFTPAITAARASDAAIGLRWPNGSRWSVDPIASRHPIARGEPFASD
jgi:hypothetical protein